MRDLRPISLCNVVYKIPSKTFVNRLVEVIGKCVSEEQLASIAGRYIVDNALRATKVVHYLKCKKKGLHGDAALKLDVIRPTTV